MMMLKEARMIHQSMFKTLFITCSIIALPLLACTRRMSPTEAAAAALEARASLTAAAATTVAAATLTVTLTATTTLTPSPTTQIPTPTVTATSTLTIIPSKPIYGTTANEARTRIQQDGVITIGVRYDAPPFGEQEGWSDDKCNPLVYDPNFKPTGYDIDIANEFAKEWSDPEKGIELRVELRCVPVISRTMIVRTGAISIGIFSFSKLPERCDNSDDKEGKDDPDGAGVECSTNYMVDGQGVLVRNDSGISQLCDNNIRTVAVLSGTSAVTRFEDGFAEFCPSNLVPMLVTTYTTRPISDVLSGAVSAYATNVEILESLANQYTDMLTVARGEFGQEEFGIAVTPGETGLLALIDQTLQEMGSDGGTLAELKRKAGFKCTLPEDACPTPGEAYVIKLGDTLGGISRQAYGDLYLWPCLADAIDSSGRLGDHPEELQASQTITMPSKLQSPCPQSP